MTNKNDPGWTWLLILAALAVGICWVVAQQIGPSGCPWPAGDPRNPTGCVIYVTPTTGATP